MESYDQSDDDGAAPYLEAEQEPDARELEGDRENDDTPESEVAEPFAVEHVNDAMKLYLRDIQRTKLLTAGEEKELALRIDQGDRAARDRMITCNLRLVVKIAKRFLNRGLPFLDLIEEGNLGLMKAVERFEIARGFRFSTYATWWIRQSVERALMNQAHTIRLPVHIAEEISKLYRATYRFRLQEDREPTPEEVAQLMGVELSQARKLMVLAQKTYSINQPTGENGDFYLSDTIEDTSSSSPADQVDNQNAYELATSLIEKFSDTEKKILALRFGLNDNTPQTLESIGRSFGVSRERIRQIESAALAKLRELMGSRDDMIACC